MSRSLAQIVEAHELSELIIDNESLTLTIRRGPHHTVTTAGTHAVHVPMAAPMHALAPAAAPAAEPAPVVDDNLHEVTSPFVGTFYRAPNPDASSYCEIGQRVEKGQVLCIIEAMKLMNEIEADAAGILEAILVENAEPVEYGQPLFKIKA
ncbi:MAG: acetyl-CoA carboxylase biotin carboxyl carrier protein [Kofleriaceae bacterium]|nr:acetyl-CoA carboxylase biotin carboxyl carrier protein [Kofleriaceae bacterium]